MHFFSSDRHFLFLGLCVFKIFLLWAAALDRAKIYTKGHLCGKINGNLLPKYYTIRVFAGRARGEMCICRRRLYLAHAVFLLFNRVSLEEVSLPTGGLFHFPALLTTPDFTLHEPRESHPLVPFSYSPSRHPFLYIYTVQLSAATGSRRITVGQLISLCRPC